MPRFRKKPIVVEAAQWFPDESICVGYDQHGVEYTVCDRCIQTAEGPMRISPGDWIITGVAGERYPCKPEIFSLTYEHADCEEMEPDEEGWSEWIHPHGNDAHGYLMQCCDCELIHEMEFVIVPRHGENHRLNEGEDDEHVIIFRARRFDEKVQSPRMGAGV